MKKREVDLLILSDIHLGTYGCQARELLHYLQSVKPKRLVLNGDIIDVWQFKKRYWPKTHMMVIKHIVNWIAEGVEVDYVTGNHDELMRKFVGLKIGSFCISNKLLLDLAGNKTWIFHGDVFDLTMKHSRWLCRLGAVGYDLLILVNSFINYFSLKLGRGRISLSKKVKNSVKKAVKFIDDFEMTAAEIGIDNQYQTVICGHIHQQKDRMIHKGDRKIRYLNSGDWIENCTALEYTEQEWILYEYYKDQEIRENTDALEMEELDKHSLFNELVVEFDNLRSREAMV